MASWAHGRSTVDYLLGQGKLEALIADDRQAAAVRLVDRAALRLRTAKAGLKAGDPEGAFISAYDAYRMAADALLLRQGLRATGGHGSHAVVEDAASAQFSAEVSSLAKPTFERFRRTRNAAQYFDPDAPEIEEADAAWAIETATAAVGGARTLLSDPRLGPYQR